MIFEPWLQLVNGAGLVMLANGDVELRAPDEAPEFSIEHVAHSLALLNRFNGHSTEPYSVAQHSVYVSRLLNFDAGVALYGLLHDAHEIVLGDIPTPLKARLSAREAGTLRALEDRTQTLLLAQLGLVPQPDDYAAFVKRADLVALATEKRDLMAASYSWGAWLDGYPPHPSRIKPLPWQAARAQFVKRYNQLIERCRNANTRVFKDAI